MVVLPAILFAQTGICKYLRVTLAQILEETVPVATFGQIHSRSRINRGTVPFPVEFDDSRTRIALMPMLCVNGSPERVWIVEIATRLRLQSFEMIATSPTEDPRLGDDAIMWDVTIRSVGVIAPPTERGDIHFFETERIDNSVMACAGKFTQAALQWHEPGNLRSEPGPGYFHKTRQLAIRSQRSKELAWFSFNTETKTYDWEDMYTPILYRAERLGNVMGFLENLAIVESMESGWRFVPKSLEGLG